MVDRYGAYDGIDLLPQLSGDGKPPARTLFWRLQGQAAVLDGSDKLIRLSHRPAQLFQPAIDIAEQTDLATSDVDRLRLIYQKLAEWESMLSTVPLWGSSPYWVGISAKEYDTWLPRPEPK